jgi:hypothetical protein
MRRGYLYTKFRINTLCFREKSGRESVIVQINDEYKTVAVTNVKVRIQILCILIEELEVIIFILLNQYMNVNP